jgi:nitrogen fixation protein NifB
MAECDTDSLDAKRDQIIESIKDCDAVLTMRIGYHAKENLQRYGVFITEYCDTVEAGLRYAASQIAGLPLKQASGFK